MKPYKVYVLTDMRGCVTDINSDAFLSSVEGWQQIDEGHGDKYRHAQGNYLPTPLMDDDGIYRYKLVGGEIVKRSTAELDADQEAAAAHEPSTDAGRIAALEQQIEMLLAGVTADE